jgi:hypothetical protein
VMSGRKPRRPADWHDDEYRPGRPAGDGATDSGSSKSPIGGPASEH